MKTNYLNEQLKQFLLGSALFVSIATLSTIAHAGDRAGNGGSGDESQLAAQQAQLEGTSLKIKRFFTENESSLKTQFPEVDIAQLVKKIESSSIKAVDAETLTDKHGKSRTCLNFPDSLLIECKAGEISSLSFSPAALFVLVLHEYFGIVGVEETSPDDPTKIDGYSISKRIAGYVTKINDYDLIMNHKAKCNLKLVENPGKVEGNKKEAYKIVKKYAEKKGYQIVYTDQAPLTLKYAVMAGMITEEAPPGAQWQSASSSTYAHVHLSSKDGSISEARESRRFSLFKMEKTALSRLKEAMEELPHCNSL